MLSWLIFVILFIAIAGSIYFRARRYRQTTDSVEGDTSPFSVAIKDLISTAGGLYLTLVMLASFLKLEMPERVFFWGLSLDPIASTAIILAIVQPLFFGGTHEE